MEDVVQALMMAFAVLIFVIGFSVAMYMFSQVTTTAETLVFYTDTTAYYDNVKIDESKTISNDEEIKNGKARIVNAETIIPTLYRYAEEEFCVKIYDDNNNLIQIFDLDLEGKIPTAISDPRATSTATTQELKANYAYKQIYNDPSKPYYFFGAPWGGSKENIKTRVDFFVNGDAGYIGGQYVNYKDDKYNKFHEAIENGTQFKEKFISYSWGGETMSTKDGDVLVTGSKPKDKIIIIYTMMKPVNLDED